MSEDLKVGLKIDAGVDGRDSIVGLSADLRKLGDTLDGPLSAAAKEVADRLSKLAQTDAAISGFGKLKQSVADTAAKLEALKEEAKATGQAISQSEAPTKAQTATLEKLRTAIRGTQDQLTSQRVALDKARAGLSDMGISSTKLAQAQTDVRAAMAAVKAEATELAAAANKAAAAQKLQAAASAQSATDAQTLNEKLSGLGNQLRTVRDLAAAAFAGQFVADQIKQVAETADAYNNLSSRIKIVTGDGDALRAAIQGVQEVALSTNSSLVSTGDLFTRIARAGKDMGVSQQAALALTQSINQAIQLSGGSAASADAAVTQLIQGLQSGVLRGDEFNSVMEQAPRLAQALADGLGVTTGQLRNMANQGQLTSETVISALQLQSQAIQGEFDKLPTTVGRALQNLSTAWTVYVGETDKATGASHAAAVAIEALANNLPIVADALYAVGKAGAAFTALRLAQIFLGIGTAAKTAAVEVAASATAMTAAGSAAAGAAASAGRLATILGGLKTFTFLGLLTSLPQIGTWLGETVAKLAGYRDRTQEIAAAEAARNEQLRQESVLNAQLAAQRQAAINAQFDLSKAALGAIAQFDSLRKSGTLAADAVLQIGKGFDTGSMQGIRDFSAALNKLAADGKVGADDVGKAWAAALKGADLGVFATTATAALQGVTGGAERLKTVLDQVSQEALRRVGSSLQEVQTGFSEAFNRAASNTDALATSLRAMGADAQTSGRLLSTAFDQELAAANTRQAVDAVVARMTELGKQGQITGDQLTAGLEKARQKSDELTPGINSLAEAYKTLGITSDKALSDTAAKSREAAQVIEQQGGSVREVSAAWQKYLQDAIAANGGAANETMQAEAAAHGLEIAVDASGKAFVRAAGSAQQMGASAVSAANAGTGAIQNQTTALEQNIAAREKAIELARREIEVANQEKGLTKDGWVADSAGNKVVGGGQLYSELGIINYLKSAGMDEATAAQLAKQMLGPGGKVKWNDFGSNTMMMASQLGVSGDYGPYGPTPEQLLSALVVKYIDQKNGGAGSLKKTAPGLGDTGIDAPSRPAPSASGGVAATAPAAKTVNVNLNLPGGITKTVPVQGDAAAQQLIEALKQAGLTSNTQAI